MTKRVLSIVFIGLLAAIAVCNVRGGSDTIEMTEATQLIDIGYA